MVRRAARRATVKAGVHILRHTFCSHLAMRGAPARAIPELAGHQDRGTTQCYMHLSPAAIGGDPVAGSGVRSAGDIDYIVTGRVGQEWSFGNEVQNRAVRPWRNSGGGGNGEVRSSVEAKAGLPAVARK